MVTSSLAACRSDLTNTVFMRTPSRYRKAGMMLIPQEALHGLREYPLFWQKHYRNTPQNGLHFGAPRAVFVGSKTAGSSSSMMWMSGCHCQSPQRNLLATRRKHTAMVSR
jgi:hypothetical protein